VDGCRAAVDAQGGLPSVDRAPRHRRATRGPRARGAPGRDVPRQHRRLPADGGARLRPVGTRD